MLREATKARRSNDMSTFVYSGARSAVRAGEQGTRTNRTPSSETDTLEDALQRRPAVQELLQLRQTLDARGAIREPRMSLPVVQRATEQELNETHGHYVDIVREIRAAGSAAALEPLLARLYYLVSYISGDTDHETKRQAYSGIYDFVDKLIDRVQSMDGGDALIDSYLAPILDILRRASQVARGEVAAYEDTLRTVDPDGAGLNMVIAQAAYMSGDMFGVSAALTLDPRLGVAIFYDNRQNRAREIEGKLLDFYRTREGEHPRVALIPVGNSQVAYKRAVAGDFSDPKIFPHGRPAILSAAGTASTIGNATRIVADAYGRNPETAQEAVEDEWLPEGAKEGTATGRSDMSIAEWCHAKGIGKGPSYAFIWYRRSGAKGGAHKELDTSATATSQIIRAAREGSAADRIVLIGDGGYDGEAQPDIDLTEFWTEPGTPFYGSGRKMQLALFAYLKNANIRVMNVGMRSGALEGPALLGIKTVFLEEKYNLQEGRMDQWQGGVVPGFERVELEHVPTREGKEELSRLIAVTVRSNRMDYDAAIDNLAFLLRREPGDISDIVAGGAGAGINVRKGIYEPDRVDDVLPAIARALGKLVGGRIPQDLWPRVRAQLRAAIRSWQEWGKALVKETLIARYEGPDEGLNRTDENKLWAAIGTNVGGWRQVGGGGKKHSKNLH